MVMQSWGSEVPAEKNGRRRSRTKLKPGRREVKMVRGGKKGGGEGESSSTKNQFLFKNLCKRGDTPEGKRVGGQSQTHQKKNWKTERVGEKIKPNLSNVVPWSAQEEDAVAWLSASMGQRRKENGRGGGYCRRPSQSMERGVFLVWGGKKMCLVGGGGSGALVANQAAPSLDH